MNDLDNLISELEASNETDEGTTSPTKTEQRAAEQEKATAIIFAGLTPETDLPTSLDFDPGLFETHASTHSRASRRVYSYAHAMTGLRAAATALIKLYRRTNLTRYSALLDTVNLEAARIARDHLASSAAVYRPLTQRIARAAAALRNAHAEATQTAANLQLAASVLGAFGSLLQAF